MLSGFSFLIQNFLTIILFTEDNTSPKPYVWVEDTEEFKVLDEKVSKDLTLRKIQDERRHFLFESLHCSFFVHQIGIGGKKDEHFIMVDLDPRISFLLNNKTLPFNIFCKTDVKHEIFREMELPTNLTDMGKVLEEYIGGPCNIVLPYHFSDDGLLVSFVTGGDFLYIVQYTFPEGLLN